MASAAATVKKVFLELGGKSANLILDDADFSTALLSGLAVCYHAGQGCAITTRILLPKSRYAEGVETLKAMFGYIQLGDQHAPQQILAPLASARQRPRVLASLENGTPQQEQGRGGKK